MVLGPPSDPLVDHVDNFVRNGSLGLVLHSAFDVIYLGKNSVKVLFSRAAARHCGACERPEFCGAVHHN